VNRLPPPVARVLEGGTFCHAAALTPLGPHVTPMVFALAGGRVWVTTSRGSVKSRSWRADPRVAGLVRTRAGSVAFVGTATAHDALDAGSWGRSIARAPLLSLASARFVRKNARYFAGYAVDARRVPLAWTPPGRVFVELSIERAALFQDDRPPRTWGEWPIGTIPSAERFRARRAGPEPLAGVPGDVEAALGRAGAGALAIDSDGPVVLPAAWTVDGSGLYAAVARDALELAAPASATVPAALEMDRPSPWRARDMLGAMARGAADVHVVDRLVSGARSARAVVSAVSAEGSDVAVARIRATRIVWWRGWTSGTVVPG
jgi:nitroimidazol reductase NimA-like FMN-containing flavoprotein (pyridoxamine 5'-phosphate oxidase superfamily)